MRPSAILILAAAGCASSPARAPDTPPPTTARTVTPTPSSSSSPTPTVTLTPTLTPTPTPTPSPTPSPSPCISVDADDLSGATVTLEGTVFSGRHSHPNGSSFAFYGLQLAKPRCVTGLPDTSEVAEVQLMSQTDEQKQFGPFDGARVTLRGDAFPEHTAWHVRPVLVIVRSIAKK